MRYLAKTGIFSKIHDFGKTCFTKTYSYSQPSRQIQWGFFLLKEHKITNTKNQKYVTFHSHLVERERYKHPTHKCVCRTLPLRIGQGKRNMRSAQCLRSAAVAVTAWGCRLRLNQSLFVSILFCKYITLFHLNLFLW